MVKKVVVGLVGPPLAGKETVGNIGMDWAKQNSFTSKRHRYRDVLEETLNLLNEARENGYCLEDPGCAETLRQILEKWSIDETNLNLRKLIKTLGDAYGYDAKKIEIGRESLQVMAQIMVKEESFGENALAHATGERLVKSFETIVWGDGVRWLADERYLRNLPNARHPDTRALILYVNASETVRFKRLRMRLRENEGGITFEKFQEQGRAKNEIYIPDIGGRADKEITNNHEPGSLTEEQTREFLRRDVINFCNEMILPLLEKGINNV